MQKKSLKTLLCCSLVLFLNINNAKSIEENQAHSHNYMLSESEKVENKRISKTVRAVAKVMPSVVNISTQRVIKLEPSINDLVPKNANSVDDAPVAVDSTIKVVPKTAAASERTTYSLGSGCIISEDGLVLTNSHVIKSATKISITTYDGEVYDANVVASNEFNDIALIKIIPADQQKKTFKPIEMAPIGSLFLGEDVIAVGNPLGLSSTVSRGILSGINRKLKRGSKVIFKDLLQTDAAITTGYSGGPLININGEMVGLTTAIHRKAYGISFAVPLLRVENVLSNWLTAEKLNKVNIGFGLGVRYSQSGLLSYYVKSVVYNSPAWKSGLRVDDIITEIDGKPLQSLAQACLTIAQMKANQKMTLIDSKNRLRTITAQKINTDGGAYIAKEYFALGLQPLTDKLQTALNYPNIDGLIVNENLVLNNGVKRGDILIKVNDYSVTTLDDLALVYRAVKNFENVNLTFIEVISNAVTNEQILKRKVVAIKLRK
ncbi:trypsin-like peptidase domain-containing protein [Lentisphaerota bacterium WC36G]|nr:trypsin-like peptidase domain-containing protein [Lentisphaerae bacterium WC36]